MVEVRSVATAASGDVTRRTALSSLGCGVGLAMLSLLAAPPPEPGSSQRTPVSLAATGYVVIRR